MGVLEGAPSDGGGGGGGGTGGRTHTHTHTQKHTKPEKDEGLENMWKRHSAMAEMLWQGLGDLGLKPFVEKPEDR